MNERFLFYISACDVLCSASFFISVQSFGNKTLCDVQAFFIQFSIAVVFWNVAQLAHIYLRVVRNVAQARLDQFEWVFHICCWTWPFGTAILSAALNITGPAGQWCSIKVTWINILFKYVPLWIAITTAFTLGIYVFLHIRAVKTKILQERKSSSSSKSKRNSTSPSNGQEGVHASYKEHRLELTKYALHLLYTSVFVVCWGPGSVSRIAQFFGYTSFGLTELHTTFVPLQGFLNLMVNIYIKWRIKNRNSNNSQGVNSTFNLSRWFKNIKIKPKNNSDPKLSIGTKELQAA